MTRRLPALAITACLIFTGCGPGIDEGGCSADGDCPDCERCDSGQCVPEICDHPPNGCFEHLGVCRDRTCHYEFRNGASCSDVDPCTVDDTCTNGACAGTPMTCGSPPQDECLDANTLRTYGTSGSCMDGACEYPHQDDVCTSGCKSGTCNPDPGKELWSFETPGRILSSPAMASDGTIYIADYGYMFYAVNADGEEKLRCQLDEPTYNSSPAVGRDGTIYIGAGDYEGVLYALRPEDCSEKWRFTVGTATTNAGMDSSPAIGDDGTIYVGSDDHNLYAVNPEDGSEKWSFPTGYQVHSSPSIGGDGTIYVGSDDEKLYAIHPEDGSEKWRFQTGNSVRSSPAIGGDGTVYFGSWDYNVYAANPQDGSEKWRFTTGAEVSSSPVIGSDGTIYIGSCDGNLYALDPVDGSERWRFSAGGCVFSSAAVGNDGTVYAGLGDGYLYAIDPEDGSEKWRFKTSYVTSSSPTIGSDGTVYLGSNTADKGWLHAVTGTSPLADTPWPKFRANPKNTGRR